MALSFQFQFSGTPSLDLNSSLQNLFLQVQESSST